MTALRTLAVAAVIPGVFLVTPATVAAKKPVTQTPASIAFHDRVGDRITSDGLGSYTNGAGGVSCVIFSSTGDAHLELGSSSPIRVMNIDPSQRISGTGPTTPFSTNGSLNIEHLAQMLVGETKLTTAVFGSAVGQFQLRHASDPAATDVSATRLDAHMWTVTTDDPLMLGAGDAAVLLQFGRANKVMKTGFYHLPFELTVSCPTCTVPLP